MKQPRVRIINHYARDGRDDSATMTVAFKGDDGDHLRKLIEHIKEVSSGGHSFSVVVDPGDSEYEQTFSFDGDGAFRIDDIKVSK